MYGDQTFNVPLQQADAPYQPSSDATTSLVSDSDEPWNWSQEDGNLTLQALLTQFSTPFGMLCETDPSPSHQRQNDPTSSSFLPSSFTPSQHHVLGFVSERTVDGLNYPNGDMASLNMNLGFPSLASQGFSPHQGSLVPPSGVSAVTAAEFGLLPNFPPPASPQPIWNNTQLESFLQFLSPFGTSQPHSLAPPSQLPLPTSSSSSLSGFGPMPLAPVASVSSSMHPTATSSTGGPDPLSLASSEPMKPYNTATTTTTGEASTSRQSKKQAASASTGPDLSHLPPSLRAQVAAANRARDAAQSNPSTHPTIPKAAPTNLTGDLPLLFKPWVPNMSSAEDSTAFVLKPLTLGDNVGDAANGTKSATEKLAEGAALGYPTLQSMQDELKEAEFYTSLTVVMGCRGVVIDTDGYRINDIKVDLFKLFQTVMLQGPGGERVELDHAWPKVALSMGLPTETPWTQQLATVYSEVLSPYETAWANALLKQRDKLALLRRAPTSLSDYGGPTLVTPVAGPLRAEVPAGSGADGSRFEEIGLKGSNL